MYYLLFIAHDYNDFLKHHYVADFFYRVVQAQLFVGNVSTSSWKLVSTMDGIVEGMKNDDAVDMEVDMVGRELVGTVDVVIPKQASDSNSVKIPRNFDLNVIPPVTRNVWPKDCLHLSRVTDDLQPTNFLRI